MISELFANGVLIFAPQSPSTVKTSVVVKRYIRLVKTSCLRPHHLCRLVHMDMSKILASALLTKKGIRNYLTSPPFTHKDIAYLFIEDLFPDQVLNQLIDNATFQRYQNVLSRIPASSNLFLLNSSSSKFKLLLENAP